MIKTIIIFTTWLALVGGLFYLTLQVEQYKKDNPPDTGKCQVVNVLESPEYASVEYTYNGTTTTLTIPNTNHMAVGDEYYCNESGYEIIDNRFIIVYLLASLVVIYLPVYHGIADSLLSYCL